VLTEASIGIFLFNFIFAFVVALIGAILKTKTLNNIYSLVVLLPGIAVGVRRMHDVGKSGWYLLIPIYNLVLACTEGTPGSNQYGADPNHPAIYQEIENIGKNQD
jgi:uncharacterized membrane protein YhaH (DUF805 family)